MQKACQFNWKETRLDKVTRKARFPTRKRDFSPESGIVAVYALTHCTLSKSDSWRACNERDGLAINMALLTGFGLANFVKSCRDDHLIMLTCLLPMINSGRLNDGSTTARNARSYSFVLSHVIGFGRCIM